VSDLIPNITRIPAPRTPLIDERTGLMSREWYRFFYNLFDLAGGGGNFTSLTDLQKGPPDISVEALRIDFNAPTNAPSDSALVSQVADIDAQLNALESQPECPCEEYNAETQKDVNGLEMLPRAELGTMAALQQANLPWITFDTTASGVPPDVGTAAWDGGTTLGIQATPNVLIKVGESEYIYARASAAITKGQVCYHTGAVGSSGVTTVAPAPIGLTDANQIVGIAAESILINDFGLILISGDIKGFDTTGSSVGEVWADGDPLYYNPAFVGSMTKVKPSAPNMKTYMGEVINAGSGGSGSMHVRIVPGSTLGGTDSNVQFGTLINKDLIEYDSVAQYWKNVAPSSIVIGTATNLAGGTAGAVPYQTAPSTTTFLNIGTALQVLKVNAGATAPEWVSGAALTKVDDTNVTLTLGGTPASSLLAATSLTLGWAGQLAVSRGGTGLSSGTSGGVLYYSAAGTLASSATLAANNLVVGGGAGVAPSTITTGTGVVTALGVNTGTAGAFVVNGGALGTPSSGTVTNLTGTASININGTVGATTPTTGAFTTVSASDVATFSAGTVSAPAITTTGDPNTGIFFPAADTIAFTEGGAEAMRLNSSGNLGIGTAAPGARLDITSPTAFTARFSGPANAYVDVTDGTGTFRAQVVAGEPYLNAVGAYSMIFRTNSIERMRITSTGLVGIGTSSPGYPLSVGNSTAPTGVNVISSLISTDTAAGLNVGIRKSNDGTNAAGLAFMKSRGTNASPTAVQSGDTISQIQHYAFGGTNYRALTGIVSTVDTYVSDTNMSSSMGFYTTNAGTTQAERLRITPAGNVGIGTTTPYGILAINPGATGSPQVLISQVSGNPFITINRYTGSGSNYYGRRIQNNVGNLLFEYAATGDQNGGQTFSEQMRLDTSGNLGIGTASPVNKLQVNGSLGRNAPVTKTGNFTLADTENWLICNGTGTITVTFPAASSWTGREVMIKTVAAFTVISASSNVVPIDGTAAGTAILAATAGKWATLVSDGTNWIIMQAN